MAPVALAFAVLDASSSTSQLGVVLTARMVRVGITFAVTVAFCVVNLVQTGTWQILGPALTKQISGEARCP